MGQPTNQHVMLQSHPVGWNTTARPIHTQITPVNMDTTACSMHNINVAPMGNEYIIIPSSHATLIPSIMGKRDEALYGNAGIRVYKQCVTMFDMVTVGLSLSDS